MKSLGYLNNDNITILTGNQHAAETITSMLGSIMAGFNVSLSDNNNDIKNILQMQNPRAMLISPSLKLKNGTTLNEFHSLFPQMQAGIIVISCIPN